MTAEPIPDAEHAEPTVARRRSEFTELSREIKASGLLERRHGYYAVKLASNAVLFTAGILTYITLGNSWWQLFTAAFFSVMFAQFAFIGHDAGHRQIYTSKKANDAVGLVHGALTGLSYRWWVDKHNQHHANPNHEDEDPDLEIPVLAFSRAQAEQKRGIARWITKHQAVLFFPLLMLEAVMLHIASVQAVLRREVKSTKMEAILLFTHIAGYLTAVFLVLSPLTGIAFIVVHQALLGIYLGCSFAPNHKGMPMVDKDDKVDFLRKQVLTSRNVRGNWWVDFTLGGLNYQIEHHLFPNMPRPNLRHAQDIVRNYCGRYQITYTQTTARHSYAEVLRHLNHVSEPLRVRPRSAH